MVAVQQYQWPGDLPDGCPPTGASPASGVFYRFVKSDPPTMDDFRRPIDLPRRQPIPPDELCAFCALSLYADLDDVALAREYIPGFRKKRVAMGELRTEMGVIHRSPQLLPTSPPVVLESHTDWWVPTSYTICPPFHVVTT